MSHSFFASLPLRPDKNKNSLYDDTSEDQVSGALGPYCCAHKLIPEGGAGPLGYSIAQLINSSKVFSTSSSETGSWALGSKRTRVVCFRCGQNTGIWGCTPPGRQGGRRVLGQVLGVGNTGFPDVTSSGASSGSALPTAAAQCENFVFQEVGVWDSDSLKPCGVQKWLPHHQSKAEF